MILLLCRVSWLKGAGLGSRESCPLQHFPLKEGGRGRLFGDHSSLLEGWHKTSELWVKDSEGHVSRGAPF